MEEADGRICILGLRLPNLMKLLGKARVKYVKRDAIQRLVSRYIIHRVFGQTPKTILAALRPTLDFDFRRERLARVEYCLKTLVLSGRVCLYL